MGHKPIYHNDPKFSDRQVGQAMKTQIRRSLKLMGFVDLLLYVHGKQLRSCWNGQLLNHKLVGV